MMLFMRRYVIEYYQPPVTNYQSPVLSYQYQVSSIKYQVSSFKYQVSQPTLKLRLMKKFQVGTL